MRLLLSFISFFGFLGFLFGAYVLEIRLMWIMVFFCLILLIYFLESEDNQQIEDEMK